MSIEQIKTAVLVVAVVAYLTITAPSFADQDYRPQRSDENLELVVRNMTRDFHAFRICGEQAKVLAEQTAAFGTIGIMSTIAAVGIGPLVLNVAGTKTSICPGMA